MIHAAQTDDGADVSRRAIGPVDFHPLRVLRELTGYSMTPEIFVLIAKFSHKGFDYKRKFICLQP